MSQQEFFPSPQSSKQDELADVEIAPQRPISWSSKFKTGDVTKNEHPSTYEEESLPPYSYAAQDRRSTASGRAMKGEQLHMSSNTTSTNARPGMQQSLSPDGDAMEYGYRPYRSTTRIRSLRKGRNNILRVIALVICLIVLMKLLPFLATAFVTLLGIGLFLILLPILIVLAFVLIFGGLVLLLLSRLGFPVWRNLFGRRRWSNGWRWRW